MLVQVTLEQMRSNDTCDDGHSFASAWEYHAGQIPFSLDDVAEVLASEHHSDEGYAQVNIVAVFRLKDGRYATLEGGCDTTGWDCRSDARGDVRDTLGEAVLMGLTPEQRALVGWEG